MPDRKINFCSNLPCKIFNATFANADTGSLKSLHVFNTCLDHMMAKFEPNCTVQNVQNLELLDENQFRQSVDATCKTFL